MEESKKVITVIEKPNSYSNRFAGAGTDFTIKWETRQELFDGIMNVLLGNMFFEHWKNKPDELKDILNDEMLSQRKKDGDTDKP